MRQLYDRAFFDWVRLTGQRSAERLLPVVLQAVRPSSVIDVGCGEGVWLSVWMRRGVTDICGLDGTYVDRGTLMIPPDRFVAADLALPVSLPRRFALAQSLEVAEHLPPDASHTLIASLCALSDIVLFSAAQPGQGGENHVNERHPSAWAQMFQAHGYEAFDCIRPALRGVKGIAPWYRFNTVLYANPAGQQRLSAQARATRCADLARLDRSGDLGWRIRRRLLRAFPVPAVSWLARARYRWVCARSMQGSADDAIPALAARRRI